MNHEQQSDRHEAHERGRDNPDRAWVLTFRDVWHKNPFYQGPAQLHPEEGDEYD